MANALPKNIQAKVKRAVYKKTDEFGYMECGRIESGRFLDILVDDPDVGKIIIEYTFLERIPFDNSSAARFVYVMQRILSFGLSMIHLCTIDFISVVFPLPAGAFTK